jgi:hypothetical protein
LEILDKNGILIGTTAATFGACPPSPASAICFGQVIGLDYNSSTAVRGSSRCLGFGYLSAVAGGGVYLRSLWL